MSPEAASLKQELETFIEKIRGNRDYRYSTLGLREFMIIKGKYPQEAFDELLELANKGKLK